MKWIGLYRPLLCTYRLNWARRTSSPIPFVRDKKMLSYNNCHFIRFFCDSEKILVRLVFLNPWHVSSIETTIRPFALENINKSVWALGLLAILRMVRWARWHFPPDTWFEIRALAVGGRARYLAVTEAPQITDAVRQEPLKMNLLWSI